MVGSDVDDYEFVFEEITDSDSAVDENVTSVNDPVEAEPAGIVANLGGKDTGVDEGIQDAHPLQDDQGHALGGEDGGEMVSGEDGGEMASGATAPTAVAEPAPVVEQPGSRDVDEYDVWDTFDPLGALEGAPSGITPEFLPRRRVSEASSSWSAPGLAASSLAVGNDSSANAADERIASNQGAPSPEPQQRGPPGPDAQHQDPTDAAARIDGQVDPSRHIEDGGGGASSGGGDRYGGKESGAGDGTGDVHDRDAAVGKEAGGSVSDAPADDIGIRREGPRPGVQREESSEVEKQQIQLQLQRQLSALLRQQKRGEEEDLARERAEEEALQRGRARRRDLVARDHGTPFSGIDDRAVADSIAAAAAAEETSGAPPPAAEGLRRLDAPGAMEHIQHSLARVQLRRELQERHAPEEETRRGSSDPAEAGPPDDERRAGADARGSSRGEEAGFSDEEIDPRDLVPSTAEAQSFVEQELSGARGARAGSGTFSDGRPPGGACSAGGDAPAARARARDPAMEILFAHVSRAEAEERELLRAFTRGPAVSHNVRAELIAQRVRTLEGRLRRAREAVSSAATRANTVSMALEGHSASHPGHAPSPQGSRPAPRSRLSSGVSTPPVTKVRGGAGSGATGVESPLPFSASLGSHGPLPSSPCPSDSRRRDASPQLPPPELAVGSHVQPREAILAAELRSVGVANEALRRDIRNLEDRRASALARLVEVRAEAGAYAASVLGAEGIGVEAALEWDAAERRCVTVDIPSLRADLAAEKKRGGVIARGVERRAEALVATARGLESTLLEAEARFGIRTPSRGNSTPSERSAPRSGARRSGHQLLSRPRDPRGGDRSPSPARSTMSPNDVARHERRMARAERRLLKEKRRQLRRERRQRHAHDAE